MPDATTTPAEVGAAYRAAVLAARTARPETTPAGRLSNRLAGLAARERAAAGYATRQALLEAARLA